MFADVWSRDADAARSRFQALRDAVDRLSLRGRIFVLCWASIGVACAVAGALAILSQGAQTDQRQLREASWARDVGTTLEKDFTSLTRDMYRMAASPTTPHIEAARGNLEDFRATFAASEPLLLRREYRDVHRVVEASLGEFEFLLLEHEANVEGETRASVAAYADRISVLDDAIDGAIEIVRNRTAAEQAALYTRLDRDRYTAWITIVVAVLGAAILMLALSTLIGRSIRDSIATAQHALSALARGERDVVAKGEERPDEFGDLARAVRAFRQALIEGDRLRAEAERTAAEERDLSNRLSVALSELERERAHLEDRVLERTHDLDEALRAAEEASAAKTRFIANMSHELRTPLNAIIGYTEIMREGAEDQQREDDVADHERVLSASRRLLAMINEILDLSKIEAGRMSVVAEPFDVGRLVQGAIDAVRPQAEANGNTIAVEIVRDGLGRLCSDEFKLHQCLSNLLSNAAKFTRQGLIAVRVRREGRQLVFQVVDTGIGIPADAIDRLFQPFVQADASSTRSFDGTGLGLSITRHLARLLGGDVTVESVEGRGSTFCLGVAAELAQSAKSDALSMVLRA